MAELSPMAVARGAWLQERHPDGYLKFGYLEQANIENAFAAGWTAAMAQAQANLRRELADAVIADTHEEQDTWAQRVGWAERSTEERSMLQAAFLAGTKIAVTRVIKTLGGTP